MAKLGTATKQPSERKDWDLEYSEWLAAGDGLQADQVDVQVTPYQGASVLDLANDETSVSGTRVKVWLVGGTHNATYKVTVTVITVGGRIQQDEFLMKVKEV